MNALKNVITANDFHRTVPSLHFEWTALKKPTVLNKPSPGILKHFPWNYF